MRIIHQSLVTREKSCSAGPGAIQGRACVTSLHTPFAVYTGRASVPATGTRLSHLGRSGFTLAPLLAAGGGRKPNSRYALIKRTVPTLRRGPKSVKQFSYRVECKTLQDRDLDSEVFYAKV